MVAEPPWQPSIVGDGAAVCGGRRSPKVPLFEPVTRRARIRGQNPENSAKLWWINKETPGFFSFSSVAFTDGERIDQFRCKWRWSRWWQRVVGRRPWAAAS
ncbi:hypothetical protein CXB51_009985 [Gossypium anomalum]|uniref:Uncharacterized protein n=1 Tax=Gossypium anomalum TaxID=47600 RepID=A0A8J6D631_9ROSI|nr:hypothetical protein CXB51_009985 [Gossypium anomalum]